jgi:hypothetical protein
VAGEHGQPGASVRLHLLQGGYSVIVKGRVMRNHISPDAFCEDLLEDDLRVVRALPFPAWMPREIWFRTQHERIFRRLRVLDVAVAEIGWLQPDVYIIRTPAKATLMPGSPLTPL